MTQTGIRPVVDKLFAWEGARKAFEMAIAGDVFGKLGIRI